MAEPVSVRITCPFDISKALGVYVGVRVVSFMKVPPVEEVQRISD